MVTATRALVRTCTYMLGLTLVLLMASCGSDSKSAGTEEEQVMQMFNEWQISFAEGDGDATCSKLTESGRNEVVRYGRIAAGTGNGDASCEEVVHQTVELTDKAGVKQQPSKAISARIRGNRAVLQVVDDGRPPVPGHVVKEDGEWKLPTAGFASFLGEKPAKR
jgi:hypothetical protein